MTLGMIGVSLLQYNPKQGIAVNGFYKAEI